MKEYVEIILYHVHSSTRSFVQGTFGQRCRKMQFRSSRNATNANDLGMSNMSQWSI